MSGMTLGEQLQAALVAKQWAADDRAHAKMEGCKPNPFQITNNLSRTTFERIKNHPDTRKNVTDALVARGYKVGSVSAIIGHMIKNEVVVKDSSGVLRTTVPEYQPLKNSKTLANRKKKEQGRKKVIVNVRKRTTQVVEEGKSQRPVSSSAGAGLTALVPKEKEIPRVDALLRSLSVLEARDLYEALRNIFGGDK